MTNHLSDEQLATLKKRLLKDLGETEEMIKKIEEQDPFKDPQHLIDNGPEDDVQEQLGHETVETEVKTLKKKQEKIEKALRKMEEGTYGVDEQSGDPIPYERLEVVPEAQYTIENQKRRVK